MIARDPHEDRKLEAVMREVGDLIEKGLAAAQLRHGLVSRKVGFAFIVFDFGPGGFLSYMSNANRSDMAQALREWLERVGGSA